MVESLIGVQGGQDLEAGVLQDACRIGEDYHVVVDHESESLAIGNHHVVAQG